MARLCPALIVPSSVHVPACCCSTTVGESVRISIRLGGPVGKLYNKSRELRIPNFTKSGSGRHVLLTHVRIRILINFPAKNVSAGVVVDYADMTMTMYVLCGHYWKNFEGFSQILQEQSGEKGYSGVFTHPKAIILKI